MLTDVVLIHRKGTHPFRLLADSGDYAIAAPAWHLWPTCLRQLALGSVHELGSIELHPEDQIHRGLDAYRVCFEIACGLHSPLVGETEVFGQFKKASDSWNLPNTPIGLELRRFIQGLLADVKKVRSRHLADLGSQSYGSLLRRELKATRDIHILGGGQLVEEILPWLCKDGTRIFVHVRNLARTQPLQEKFSQVQFLQLDSNYCVEVPTEGALVIAAPVSAEWLCQWMQKLGAKFEQIADLRGEASVDRVDDALRAFTQSPKNRCELPASHSAPVSLGETSAVLPAVLPVVLELEKLLQQMTANLEQIEDRKIAALAEIESLVLARGRHIEYRPFGWEDVCA